MLRILAGAIALASGVSTSIPASVAAEGVTSPMQFEWRREGPAETCGADCRVWISATGYITADTLQEFEVFARERDVRGAVLALDSDGGSVLGTLALGRAIRSLDMVTTVGRSTTVPADRADNAQSTLDPDGRCESMCAFLLLAGTRRYVPPEAQILVHQIWLGKKRKRALEQSYTAEELNVVQRDIGRLARYTFEMGGGADLLERALQVPPWEPMYRLSAEEVQRMRLSTIDGLLIGSAPGAPSTSATSSLATVGRQAAPQDY
jgi:hypothetical protein